MKTRKQLTQAFVGMSQLYRDLALDFSITTLHPKDALMLRDSIQAVLRTLLSLRTESSLWNSLTHGTLKQYNGSRQELPDFIIVMGKNPPVPGQGEEQEVLQFVTESLTVSTENVLDSMKIALQMCDAALMDASGHRRYIGPPHNISSDVSSALLNLRKEMAGFKNQQEQVLSNEKLSDTYSRSPKVLKIFALSLSVYHAASSIELLATHVYKLQQKSPRRPRLNLPSYPFWKAIYQVNAQVRHDTGGVTAGRYPEQ